MCETRSLWLHYSNVPQLSDFSQGLSQCNFWLELNNDGLYSSELCCWVVAI